MHLVFPVDPQIQRNRLARTPWLVRCAFSLLILFIGAPIVFAADDSAIPYPGFVEPALDAGEEARLEAAAQSVDQEAKLELLHYYRNTGNWKTGIKRAKAFLEDTPGDQALQEMRTNLQLLKLGKVGMFGKVKAGKAMLRDCEADLALAPDNSQAKLCIARFHNVAPGIAGGKKAKAEEMLARLENEDRARYFQLKAEMAKSEEEAFGASDQSLAVRIMPNVALGAAMQAMRKENWALAARYFEMINVETDDGVDHPSRMALYQQGKMAALSGEYLEAGDAAMVRFLKGSTMIGGTDFRPSAHWRRAEILQHMGRNQEALAALRHALKLDPKHEQAKKALQQVASRG
ncbi:MAG: tetratricopeptide repeat protein [Pseudomonadota bacterium]